MKPSYEAAEMIEDAADRIEKGKWFRGNLYWHSRFQEKKHGVGWCAGLAIAQSQPDSEATRGLGELVRQALDLPTTPDGLGATSALIYWNNHPDRTKQEVLDGLRLAAKRVRQQADALA